MADSPCIKQCKLSPDGKYCLGCSRTIEQIIEAGKRRTLDKPKINLYPDETNNLIRDFYE